MLSGCTEFPEVKVGSFILRLQLDDPTPEVLETARKELRETPEVREKAIKELQDLLRGKKRILELLL